MIRKMMKIAAMTMPTITPTASLTAFAFVSPSMLVDELTEPVTAAALTVDRRIELVTRAVASDMVDRTVYVVAMLSHP